MCCYQSASGFSWLCDTVSPAGFRLPQLPYTSKIKKHILPADIHIHLYIVRTHKMAFTERTGTASSGAHSAAPQLAVLTKAQLKKLRSLSHRIKPLLIIGKNNITDAVLRQAVLLNSANSSNARCSANLRLPLKKRPLTWQKSSVRLWSL